MDLARLREYFRRFKRRALEEVEVWRTFGQADCVFLDLKRKRRRGSE